MKTRMIYLFVCAFSICACSKSYDTIVQGDDISEAQVITKGDKGHEILGDYLVTKEDADFYIQVFMPDKVVKDVKEIQGNHGSTSLYIYYFEKGWAVLSGDKRLSPVLAYNEELEPIDHEYVELLNYQVDLVQANAVSTQNEYTKMWDFLLLPRQTVEATDTETKSSTAEKKWAMFYIGTSGRSRTIEEVPHLIQTCWTYGYPWNKTFPLMSSNEHEFIDNNTIQASELLYYLHYQIGKPNKLYHDVYTSSAPDSTDALYVVHAENLNQNSNRWDMMPMSIEDTLTRHPEYVSDLMLHVSGYMDLRFNGGLELPTNLMTSYGLSFSTGSYSSINVRRNILSNIPMYIYIHGSYHEYSFSKLALIDGLIKKEEWVSHDYYINYTSNYRGAYRVFDSEAEMRAFVGNDYQLGTAWSQISDLVTNEYILMASERQASNQTKYNIESPSSWINELPYNMTLSYDTMYDIR